MKIVKMTGRTGRPVNNQEIVFTPDATYFVSYGSVIIKTVNGEKRTVTLSREYWDYSTTTGKYRNQFLGETKAETLEKIKSGEYKIQDFLIIE